jgi:hypothetical protein
MRHWGFIVLLAASPAWADLEPGNWEITARTDVQGVQDPKALTLTQCLTREQAADPASLFGSSGASCEFLNKKDDGAVMTFDVACAMQPPVRGAGKVSYSSQSLEGDLELRLEGVSMRSHISGRRLGGCR